MRVIVEVSLGLYHGNDFSFGISMLRNGHNLSQASPFSTIFITSSRQHGTARKAAFFILKSKQPEQTNRRELECMKTGKLHSFEITPRSEETHIMGDEIFPVNVMMERTRAEANIPISQNHPILSDLPELICRRSCPGLDITSGEYKRCIRKRSCQLIEESRHW